MDNLSSANLAVAPLFLDGAASHSVVDLYGPVKATPLLKQHIETLLEARRANQKDLARWCHKDESWISKVLNDPRRSIRLDDLDRIADFFGLTTYQLFQPGISSLTERRHRQRRSGQERRIGHAAREAFVLAGKIERAHPRHTFSQTDADIHRKVDARQEFVAEPLVNSDITQSTSTVDPSHGRSVAVPPHADTISRADLESVYAELERLRALVHPPQSQAVGHSETPAPLRHPPRTRSPAVKRTR